MFNVKIMDSSGEFRGGRLELGRFNAETCRVWLAPPEPNYDCYLIDIAGKGKPSHIKSWFLVHASKSPDVEGPPDVPVDWGMHVDHHSHAMRLTPIEAKRWLERQSIDPPADLLALVPEAVNAPIQSDRLMPARWFNDEFGIPPERLRAAARTNRLEAVKKNRRAYYSMRSVSLLWPEDVVL
ncbi:MAG: hypothetical protein KDA20_05250 [Phycisphaerales bacterium]|nr:hypothetical protein [Phycisphaerales bacterium]